MPIGIVFMKWDERAGPTVLGKFPEEVPVQSRTLIQIVAGHDYTNEPSFALPLPETTISYDHDCRKVFSDIAAPGSACGTGRLSSIRCG